MKTYKIYEQQSWWDISMHQYGTTAYAIDLAVFNNYSPVDDLKPGTMILLPDYKPERLVLISMNSIPSTGYLNDDEGTINRPEGIDYWAISYDFIVS